MPTIVRPVPLLSLAITACLCAAAPSAAQKPEFDYRLILTCDRDAIDPESYYQTTTAQAMNLLSPRDDWRYSFEIKVNLHGETGHVEFLASPNPDYDPAMR